jgi:hypothetical protein
MQIIAMVIVLILFVGSMIWDLDIFRKKKKRRS